MVPLIRTKDKEFEPEEFKEYLRNICAQHKAQNRALAFAFLAYDFEDYTITKILQDKSYWSALDRMSGSYLSILYLDTKDQYFKKRRKQIYREGNRNSGKNHGYISYFVPFHFGMQIDVVNERLRHEFNLESRIDTPFVIFFQTNGNDIIDFFIVQLKKDRLEEAFLELKMHIENAVDALKQIREGNRENHQEIFDQVRLSIEGGKFYEFIKTKIISKISLTTFISFFKL